MRGQVLWYSPTRGWGYVQGADRRRYFMHARDIVGPPLATGEVVSFEPQEGAPARRAAGVCRVTEPGEERSA